MCAMFACTNIAVTSRYHSPLATPMFTALGVAAADPAIPSSSSRTVKAWPMSCWRPNITTFTAISAMVTTPCRACTRPPPTVRGARTVFAPPRTHSGHWWPTAAGIMQSVQMYRSQRVHRR